MSLPKKPTHLERSQAPEGTFEVNSSVEAEKTFYAAYVSKETTITRIEINGDDATDVKANYIQNAANPVPAGTMITFPAETYGSAITHNGDGSITLLLLQGNV